MSKEYHARQLDVKGFAEKGGALEGGEPLGELSRLIEETQGRGADTLITWSATGELRNPGHVHPEIWLHLSANAVLALTCQRCLSPVDVPVVVERSFRFVQDEAIAAAQDEQSEEDVLALSRSFDLIALVEDELLMELPLVPLHSICPVPVNLALADENVDAAEGARENPFSILDKFKPKP